MAHSIDFHAAMVAPNDKYRMLKAGESIRFEWVANYPGIYTYHCGTPPVLHHMAMGQYGIVVVSPRDGYPTDARVTRRYAVVQSEFYLKRLLAAHGEAIYYLGRAFRAGDRSSRHQPEFCLLEWYRPQWTAAQLMAEVAALVALFVPGEITQCSYRDVFLQHTGVDPHTAALADLQTCARNHINVAFDSDERDIWLDLLFSHLVEPKLHGKVFVQGFPASQAALARVQGHIASRFEAYLDGIELCNGFHELGDPQEQRARFENDVAQRARRGLPAVPIDENFLAALDHGLPECAGVALGFEEAGAVGPRVAAV